MLIFNVVKTNVEHPPSIANRISRESAEECYSQWLSEKRPNEYVSLSVFDSEKMRTVLLRGSWENGNFFSQKITNLS